MNEVQNPSNSEHKYCCENIKSYTDLTMISYNMFKTVNNHDYHHRTEICLPFADFIGEILSNPNIIFAQNEIFNKQVSWNRRNNPNSNECVRYYIHSIVEFRMLC
jgi:hypothetical protein